MTEATSFRPAWVSPPGDTVADLLEERGWTQTELAERLGFSRKHVSDLVHGKATITAESANALALVLGSTPAFWLSREAMYRAALILQDDLDVDADERGWLDQLPVAFMEKRGWIATSKALGDRVRACKTFFGVASVSAWETTYATPVAAWRTSKRAANERGAAAAWLRQAEIQAQARSCAPWNSARLRAALPRLRALTLHSAAPEAFVPELTSICAEHGIAVVFVPAPPGCAVSGATRFLTPTKALLALSLRYKADDHLWFSFFHEIGHLLQHSKKLMFLEGLDRLRDDEEREADQFARDVLLSPAQMGELAAVTTPEQVVALATRFGVSPGIVVGRMQHDKLIPFDTFNDLKAEYRWADEPPEG